MKRVGVLVAAATVGAFGVPATSQAAPPPNDARTSPQALSPPAAVSGTTREATLEPDEPRSCDVLSGSVWYEVRPAGAAPVVVRLAAGGDLDGVVDVFRRTRSRLTPVDCDRTDEEGRAELRFRPDAGARYLIRVGRRRGSVPGEFRLRVFAPEPPPRPPGPRLPRRGVTRGLDAVQDTADAFSAVLREGRPYRVNLSQPAGGCVSLSVFAPGTVDFESESPVRRRGCGGYLVLTPAAGEGGRYSFLAEAAPRRRGSQRYHLQVARARRDDLAPGLPLANYARVRGRLRGDRVDAVDLYRFSLARRSDVRIRVGSSGFALRLLDDRGRRLSVPTPGPLATRLSRGRYFVAVVAPGAVRGRYVLRRVTRTITRTGVTAGGRRSVTVPPGRAVAIAARVTPATGGPVRLTLERFDPLSGWRFHRRVTVRAAAGLARFTFLPPAQGRWRVSAVFLGTRRAAPSASGLASILVAPPLEE